MSKIQNSLISYFSAISQIKACTITTFSWVDINLEIKNERGPPTLPPTSHIRWKVKEILYKYFMDKCKHGNKNRRGSPTLPPTSYTTFALVYICNVIVYCCFSLYHCFCLEHLLLIFGYFSTDFQKKSLFGKVLKLSFCLLNIVSTNYCRFLIAEHS